MTTKILLAALATFACAAAPAFAAPISFDNATTITATYNGASNAVLGLDHNFQLEPGSNTSRLDPFDAGVEFLTSDFLFAFDFSRTGLLTV